MGSDDVKRYLSLIEKGHQLEGQQPSAQDLDRARRILEGRVGPEDAEVELAASLKQIQDDERRLSASISLGEALRLVNTGIDNLKAAVNDQRVLAVAIDKRIRFPAWQFNSKPPPAFLPHLGTILADVRDRDWLAVAELMVAPHPDLIVDSPQSPVDWIWRGLSVDQVRVVIRSSLPPKEEDRNDTRT